MSNSNTGLVRIYNAFVNSMRDFKLAFSILLLVLLASLCIFYFSQSTKKDELVVVVHGLARSDNAMWLMEKRLAAEGYDICLLDYKTIGQDNNTLFTDTEAQIDECLGEQKTHFVGHSLGGLVIKNYLNNPVNKSKVNIMGEVVFAGTPNHGSELADALKDHYLMAIGGEVTRSLMTGIDTMGDKLGNNTVPVGVIAGRKGIAVTEKYFSDENDGVVSVESTKLTNMKDFIVLDVSHSAMRYNKEVALQILHYLENGAFRH